MAVPTRQGSEIGSEPAADQSAPAGVDPAAAAIEGVPERPDIAGAEDDGANRRRGRRGRGRNRWSGEVLPEISAPGAEQPDLPPVYAGPTPADPFGGQAFDIFDVLERAEAQAVPSLPAETPSLAAPEPQSDTVAASVVVETPERIEPAAEPVAEPPAEPAPVASPPANDATPAEPAVTPILIGIEETAPAERKRGWWRR